MTSTLTSTRYDVLQNGVDAPVGDSSWTTTMGASGARSGANGGDDASDDADARARAMRRDLDGRRARRRRTTVRSGSEDEMCVDCSTSSR